MHLTGAGPHHLPMIRTSRTSESKGVLGVRLAAASRRHQGKACRVGLRGRREDRCR